MARRGLQALHEICAGDPEGVALNLLDAHLRNSTEPVTVDDVSEQMSLLGISDKSLAWIGARAALWRRADWARYRTAEGHLYYLRDDGVSQWEHPLQNELRQLYDAARHSPLARPPPRGGYENEPGKRRAPVRAEVKRPSWTPPGFAFPIIWITISLLRAASSTLVWRACGRTRACISACLLVGLLACQLDINRRLHYHCVRCCR